MDNQLKKANGDELYFQLQQCQILTPKNFHIGNYTCFGFSKQISNYQNN